MVEERQIIVYARVQLVRAPVWVKEFKKMTRQSREQLLRESASRVTQIMALEVNASFRQMPKSDQQVLLRTLALSKLQEAAIEDENGFTLSIRNLVVAATSETAFDSFSRDCADMLAAMAPDKKSAAAE